jgi:hypothetical protein
MGFADAKLADKLIKAIDAKGGKGGGKDSKGGKGK